MAIVNINYDCGCGYHAKTVEEAIAHVDESRHVLNVAGTVRSTERKVRKAPSSPPTSPRQAAQRLPSVSPGAQEEKEKIDFSNLRAKLQRK